MKTLHYRETPRQEHNDKPRVETKDKMQLQELFLQELRQFPIVRGFGKVINL